MTTNKRTVSSNKESSSNARPPVHPPFRAHSEDYAQNASQVAFNQETPAPGASLLNSQHLSSSAPTLGQLFMETQPIQSSQPTQGRQQRRQGQQTDTLRFRRTVRSSAQSAQGKPTAASHGTHSPGSLLRPKNQPQRTTKLQPKLVLFPETPAGTTITTTPQPFAAAEYEDGDVYRPLTPTQQALLPRVTAYCTGSGYKLEDLKKYLTARYAVTCKIYDEVMHTRFDQTQKQRLISLREGALLDLPNPDSPHSSDPTLLSDIFVFDYGSIVFWNFTEAEELVMINRLARFCVEPVSVDDIEIEALHFMYSDAVGKRRESKEHLNLNEEDHHAHEMHTNVHGSQEIQEIQELEPRIVEMDSTGPNFPEEVVELQQPISHTTSHDSLPSVAGTPLPGSESPHVLNEFDQTLNPNPVVGALLEHSNDGMTPSPMVNDTNGPTMETEELVTERQDSNLSHAHSDLFMQGSQTHTRTQQEISHAHTLPATTTGGRIFNDIITLRSSSAIIKLTISHPIAQSVELAYYENIMDQTIESTRLLPKRLAMYGEVNLHRHEVTKIMGQLYQLRMGVNLVSNVLDTPEWFWSERGNKSLYDAVREYLELDNRIRILNDRSTVVSDLLDMLAEHMHTSKTTWTTWIIIILIFLAILVALGEIAVKAANVASNNNDEPTLLFSRSSSIDSVNSGRKWSWDFD